MMTAPVASTESGFRLLLPSLIGLSDGGPVLPKLFAGCTGMLRDVGNEGDGVCDLREFEQIWLDPNCTLEMSIKRVLDEGHEVWGDRRWLRLKRDRAKLPPSQRAIYNEWCRSGLGISASMWPGKEDLGPYARCFGMEGPPGWRWSECVGDLRGLADDNDFVVCRKKK